MFLIVFFLLLNCCKTFKLNPSLGLNNNNNDKNKNNDKSNKNLNLNMKDSDIDVIKEYKSFLLKTDYNTVVQDLLHNKLSKIYIDTNYKELVSVDINMNDDMVYNHYHYANINPIVVPNIINKASEQNIPVDFINFTPESILTIQAIANELTTIISYGIPLLLLISFISGLRGAMPMIRQNSQNMMNRRPNNIMQSRQNSGNNFGLFGDTGKKDEFTRPNVSLSSWAGSPEVMEECKEIISYIEQKDKFTEIGADMPKGILLEGPPGTGKTLLAKAIASETNSSFISISGSEFVELFVGMGASRVRDLFKNARDLAPSIIFIDEIDAVGRQRGAGVNMANDEREQTLNQLLYEMDGFNGNNDIIVLAATNRKDVLDQALLRPGRFDRIVRVPLPDKESREKILNLYINNKKTISNFDTGALAELTSGFSGAQLKNLMNEAAILSVRNNKTQVEEKYVYEAFDKLVVGLIKQNANVSDMTRTRVAIHESGHALLSLIYNDTFDFQKASIKPTYNGAGGYTIFTDKPDIREGGLYTREILKKRLIVTLGGKAAEYLYYGIDMVSLGAVEDLRQANKLAQRMIGNYGMGNRLEVFFNEDVSDESSPFLGRSLALNDKYSEFTKSIMDRETLDLVNEAYKEAKVKLSNNYDKLLELSELLKSNDIVDSKQLTQYNFTIF